MENSSMLGKPLIGLDTSGLNRLAKASDSQPLAAGLRVGYRVCLNGLSVDELWATEELELRDKFLGFCRHISPEGIICLAHAGLIIQNMVAVFAHDPNAFDWKRVDVRLRVYEDAIARYEDYVTDEELSAQQRRFARETNKVFEDWFRKLRPELQAIYQRSGHKPHSYADVLKYSQEEGGVFWGFARELYRCAQEWNANPDGPDRSEGAARLPEPDHETIKRFLDACPPFRCVVLSFILTWYDRSLRGTHATPRFDAGRVDQFMAAYLPYVPQFITNDESQQTCLQEIANICGLTTQVRLYDDFYSGFMVVGATALETV
jgi:hypothetical protein